MSKTCVKEYYFFKLIIENFLSRPEENNNSSEPAHTIQSVSLAPEDSKTRVSLTIAAKSGSQPSSPKNKFPSQESLDAPTKRKNVPSGQAYMQKLVGSLNDLDDDDNDDNEENSMFYLHYILHIILFSNSICSILVYPN